MDRDLEREATQLLRRAGFTWSGRSSREGKALASQLAFERLQLSTPMGGKPGYVRRPNR